MEKTITEYQKEIDLAVISRDALQDEINWLDNRIRVRENKIAQLKFAESLVDMRMKQQ